MSMISVPKSELEYIFNIIGSSLNGTSGPLKLTKSGKPRKESSNKGKPTSHGDFTKKILAEQKEKIAEFKAAHPELKSAHLNFLKIYKEENPQEYETFKAEWALAHPKEESDAGSTTESVTEETSGSEPVAEKPKRVMSDEQKAKMKAGREASAAAKKAAKDTEAAPAESTPTETAPAEAKAPIATKPVKKAKKAITTEVVTVEASQPEVTELLPFSMGTMNYLRSGVQRSDGNHLWMSGHLWQAKKGLKGPYVGELKNDGTIDQDADEPKA
jgi:hypothetical protein